MTVSRLTIGLLRSSLRRVTVGGRVLGSSEYPQMCGA